MSFYEKYRSLKAGEPVENIMTYEKKIYSMDLKDKDARILSRFIDKMWILALMLMSLGIIFAAMFGYVVGVRSVLI